ncbi:MAG: hypothetical protein HY731_07835 [Candidatus Tectomicrobia bacterium]|nr:hypothetical protein [Candidatus Tectomicrobia bacterium]
MNKPNLGVSFIVFLTLVAFVGCSIGRTAVKKQELPTAGISQVRNGVEVTVVGVGTAKRWSELEISIANGRSEPIKVDVRKIYLINESNYALNPYTDREFQDKVNKDVGQIVNPITLTALATGLSAIILPLDDQTRRNLGRVAGGLVGAAVIGEAAKYKKAQEDEAFKGDVGLQNRNIPTQLRVGGTLYYPPVKTARGVKAYITVDGKEEIFDLVF